MYRHLLLAAAVTAAMCSAVQAAPLVVSFSQIGSESGWRSAETKVSKREAEKRGITLKIADAQQNKKTKSKQ
ncbi:putative periplasmic protein [Yersinia aldovae]|nr:putative periplasmic protein [Yersinia aldovae]